MVTHDELERGSLHCCALTSIWDCGSFKSTTHMLRAHTAGQICTRQYGMMVQWWRHLFMLWYRHAVSGSKQMHWSMHRMIALVIQYLLCVCYQWQIWHFSGKFNQHLSLYCGSAKPKFETGPGYWFLWVLWVTISKMYWQFWQSFFKYTWQNSSNFYPIEITWRKVERSVCLKPAYIMTFHCTSVWTTVGHWRHRSPHL